MAKLSKKQTKIAAVVPNQSAAGAPACGPRERASEAIIRARLLSSIRGLIDFELRDGARFHTTADLCFLRAVLFSGEGFIENALDELGIDPTEMAAAETADAAA